jgi:very-short-patch-repair endonuclease
MSPYRAQVEAIRTAASRIRDIEGLTVDTAHRFQGDERDIMVFSPTLSSSMPSHYARFANDPNLVNVSVTRARRQLWIVGDREACQRAGGVLGHLATYASDLADGRFESPVERRMYEALLEHGIGTEPGVEVNGYRLDLALRSERLQLDIECDGAAYHSDRRKDAIRDVHLREAGWEVVRFSGREINSDIERCVADVITKLNSPSGPGDRSDRPR